MASVAVIAIVTAVVIAIVIAMSIAVPFIALTKPSVVLPPVVAIIPIVMPLSVLPTVAIVPITWLAVSLIMTGLTLFVLIVCSMIGQCGCGTCAKGQNGGYCHSAEQGFETFDVHICSHYGVDLDNV